jgi:hypothetical protein
VPAPRCFIFCHTAGCLCLHTLSPAPIPSIWRAGEDPSLISKQQIFARIVGALGGRAAEEVIFGDAEVTTGASGDLQQVRPAHLSMFD